MWFCSETDSFWFLLVVVVALFLPHILAPGESFQVSNTWCQIYTSHPRPLTITPMYKNLKEGIISKVPISLGQREEATIANGNDILFLPEPLRSLTLPWGPPSPHPQEVTTLSPGACSIDGQRKPQGSWGLVRVSTKQRSGIGTLF